MSNRNPNRFGTSEVGAVVDVSSGLGTPGTPGLPGPPGEKGDKGDKGDVGPVNPGVTINQNSASASWIIDHNMGKKPTVVTVDGSGRAIRGAVNYPSDNQIIINFSVPVSGQAILN